MALDPKSGYYDAGGIEVFRYIEAKLTHEQWEGFLLGNVLKYASRCNYKGTPYRDIEKINVYAKLLQETSESE